MPKGRPGGNPNIASHGFKRKHGDESCTAHLGIRLPPSVREKLREIPNWQEKLRQAIAEIIESHSVDATDEP